MKRSYKIRKKISLLTIIACLIFGLSYSQVQKQKKKSDFWKHVRFGGGIGLSFGDGFFSGTLAPSGIYQFNNQVALGVGLSVSYYDRKNFYNSTVLGGSLIGLFNPIPEIQISSEFEELHVKRNFDENYVGNLDTSYWYPSLWLGAGYRSGNFTIGIRYDVLYDEDKSIYADPWMPFIRVYF